MLTVDLVVNPLPVKVAKRAVPRTPVEGLMLFSLSPPAPLAVMVKVPALLVAPLPQIVPYRRHGRLRRRHEAQQHDDAQQPVASESKRGDGKQQHGKERSLLLLLLS